MKTTIFKSFILAIAGLFMSTTLLLAQAESGRQQGPPPVPNADQIQKMVTDLSSELSLTTSQTEKVKSLFTDHFKELGKKQAAERNLREKNRVEMENLRSTFEKQVTSILSEEQMERFIEFQKSHNPRNEGQRRPK